MSRMQEIDYALLSVITAVTIAIYAVAALALRSSGERLFLAVTLAGLWFYTGVGAAVAPGLWEYSEFYGLFLCAFGIGFVAAVVPARRTAASQAGACYRLDVLGGSVLFRGVAIVAYLAMAVTPLFYPELKIARLWRPPAPDLMMVFNHGVAVEQPLALRIAGYIGFAVWPFYLLALYGVRRRAVLFPLLICFPVYCRYCADGYVARGDMLAAAALYVGVIWLDRPRIRLRIAATVLLAIPLVVLFFGYYSQARLGATPRSSTAAGEQIETVLLIETSLPRSWERFSSAHRGANLTSYAIWLATLAVPKVVTGPIRGARINEEINDIVADVSPGDENYTVVLTGAVIESVYLYGRWGFWIHGVFVGAVAGALCAFAGCCRSLLVLLVQLALLFGYNFSRAGIGASAPLLLNSYLTLYALAFLLWLTTVPPRGGHPEAARA